MKIGIPRALLFYCYYPFWKTLFEHLGCEVVASDETCSSIISEGSNVTVSELCVPIKIFNGHVLNLLKKGVDYIFVARFATMGKKEWYCPKFIGLTELEKYSILGHDDKILALDIRSKDDCINDLAIYLPLCEKLHVSKGQLKKALAAATAQHRRFRELCESGYDALQAMDILSGKKLAPPPREAPITIALMGYVYNIYDAFVSMGAIGKLREMGARIITFDMLNDAAVQKSLGESGEKSLYWVYARKVYQAARYLMLQPEVDGLIHMTAFGCGPDSVIGKLMEVHCERAEKPFMSVRLDEHTGESHILTRLEAYVDMLKMRKSKAEVMKV